MTRPVFVAEMSANHLGSKDRAHEIIDAAADAGADAIKFQTWSPGTMCVSDYRLDHGPWAGWLLRELYAEAWLPWEWHPELFLHARKVGLIPFSAAFDRKAVDFLEELGVDRHKVASFELVDLPLIRYMSGKGKPMILSTGMASREEIDRAIDACTHIQPGFGCVAPTILKCTSAYPANPADANLMDRLPGYPWGLSDHTMGIGVAVAAAAMGANMIEKHLTLSRADGGPDAGFSMEPAEFAQMVTECKRAADAVGNPTTGGKGENPVLRRSLWVKQWTPKGGRLVRGLNVVTARPALGMPCDTDLTGLVASYDLKPGIPLTEECVQ